MKNVKDYLMKLEMRKITPNFFTSEPYLKLAEAKINMADGWIWLEADGVCLFPPLVHAESYGDCPVLQVWSDFVNQIPSYSKGQPLYTPKFLDWEYIFAPGHFTRMVGGLWNTYRKNVRKWPRATPDWRYGAVCQNDEEAHQLIGDWLEAKQRDVQDGELLARFAFFEQDPLIFRRYLYKKRELVAINAWDMNWEFINYRVCIVKPGERYLDEFARLRFYLDPAIQESGLLVNDGGTLGNQGLERFKDKMNPAAKREMYTWTKTPYYN